MCARAPQPDLSPEVSVVAAGTVSTAGSPSGDVMLRATGLTPGSSKRGTAVVTNDGGPGSLALVSHGLSGHRLAPVLEVAVDDVTNGVTRVWDGTFATIHTVELGHFEPNELRTYRFTIGWPADAVRPEFEGLASFQFLTVARSA